MTLTLRSSTSFINLNDHKSLKASDESSGTICYAQIKPTCRLRAKSSMQETQLLQEKTLMTAGTDGRREMLHALPNIAHSSNGSKVPVYVMLPLDTVSHGGHLNKPRAMNASLMALKNAGVEGVMVDAWWGLVEKDGPSKYNWEGYAELVQMVQKHGLKIQVVMSFHQCGGNVGDSCSIPLPPWVSQTQSISYIMEILPVALVFFLATIVSTTQGYEPVLTHHIHLLTPKTGGARGSVPGLSCLSWRLAVETNNIINWKTVPAECEGYVGHYMLGHQYRKDSKVVTNGAWLYAKSLNLTKDGKNVWVFDIDETTLSNLPYYAVNGFGTELYNATSFDEWVLKGTAPALPESLKLYQKLLTLGVKVVFLTGRGEDKRNVTTTNLKNVGYHTWEKLILKGSAYTGKTSYVYKSAERTKLVKSGFRIIGNAGDQWSDILGTNVGNRTFKLPDPMYYIS